MAKSAGFYLTPLYDPVCILIQTPFRYWREVDKEDLLEMGRPQPNLFMYKKIVEGNSTLSRYVPVRKSWYFRFPWLCGSTYKQKLFCWPCLLFGDEDDLWICDQFGDDDIFLTFEHHNSKSEKHQKYCWELLKMDKYFKITRKAGQKLTVEMVSEEEIRMNRTCMQFAIDAVLYMIKHEILFDVANYSNRKNFADLVTLLFSQTSNQQVLNHIRLLQDSPNPFLSPSIQNGILESISECIEEQIHLIFKEAQFFILRVDDGPCESAECSVFLRYITNKAEMKEYFIGFYHLGSDRTSLSLFRIIDTILEAYQYKTKLVGISYDITCAKFNYLKDLRVGMKFIAQFAIHVNLMSHHLDYTLERLLCRIPLCRVFFADISTLLSLLQSSTKKYSPSNKNVSFDISSLKEPCSSRFKLLAVILEDYKGIKDCLQEMQQELEHTNETLSLISNMLERLKDFEFIFLLFLFYHLFQITNTLHEDLLKFGMQPNLCHSKVKKACVQLYSQRKDSYYSHLRLNVISIMNENYSPELIPQTSLIKNYKGLYYEVLDNVIMELHTRFDSIQQYYFLSLGDSSSFENFKPHSKLIKTRIQSLIEHYPNLFYKQTALLREFHQVYTSRQFWNLPPLKILQALSSVSKTRFLKEAYRLLSLIALLTPTRESFPCLHEINDYLVKSAPEHRLQIARILMNREVLDSISYRYSFKDDIANKLSVKCDDIKLSHMVKMAHLAGFTLTPLYDAVCLLIETPFRYWREEDKRDLLKMGRPQPIIYVNKKQTLGSQPRYKPFRRSWYYRYPWLCGSTYNQKLYCWVCLLFGSKDDLWVCDQFGDEDIFLPFEQHNSKSEVHKMCSKEFAKMEKKFRNSQKATQKLPASIAPNVDLVSEDEIRMNRTCMQYAIDAVLYMVKHKVLFDIANNSKRKNFADLVTLLFSQSSNQQVQSHLRKLQDNPNPFLSLSVQNGIIESISECIEEQIALIFKDARYFILRIDDGPCELTECSIFLRYINNEAEIKEYFLGFYHLGSDRTSLSLFRIIDTILESYQYKTKLVGISYDITCAKFNYLKDLRVGMKFMAQYAIHVNLMSHHLDYMVERFLYRIPLCRVFFADINTLLSLFQNSTKKFPATNPDASFDVSGLKEPCCSKLKFLALIIEDYKGVKDFLQEILQELEQTNETVSTISNLLERLKDFEFIFLVVFFNHLLQITNNLCEDLVKHGVDAIQCHGNVKNACVQLYNQRNESYYNHLRHIATNIMNENYSPELIPKANLQKNYKAVYYEVLDNVIMELHTRFDGTQQYYFLSLGDSSLYENFRPHSKLVKTRFQSLMEHYPNLFHNQTSLMHEFHQVYTSRRFWKLPPLKILQALSSVAKSRVLQEAYRLLSLIALLTPTRESFPCMHKINDYLKKSPPEQRLQIARTLMNREVLDSISCRYSFKDDIANKLSVKCDDIKLSHMVKGKQKEATSSKAPERKTDLVVELDPSNILVTQESNMVVELDPSAFVPENDSSQPGPSKYMEPDSSVMEDESSSMTYERFSEIKFEPGSPFASIQIKKEPEETVRHDILSATVEKELCHSAKDPDIPADQKGLLFQPPVLIKEEPISSEDEEL